MQHPTIQSGGSDTDRAEFPNPLPWISAPERINWYIRWSPRRKHHHNGYRIGYRIGYRLDHRWVAPPTQASKESAGQQQ
ncbi:hypothetical protein [Nocardia sp. NPDC005366]|uniref:hypothetical protein n=1 Tax=Nocardia sp. NPDC005366 TaxID=3156878 RepID=UPI0033B560FD